MCFDVAIALTTLAYVYFFFYIIVIMSELSAACRETKWFKVEDYHALKWKIRVTCGAGQSYASQYWMRLLAFL